MSKRFAFLRWWFGNRLLWVFVAMLPALLLSRPFISELNFYFFSAPHLGQITDYGVEKEGIGASTLRGSWTGFLYSPWINIGRPESSGELIHVCRIEGQLGVFGDWLSDDGSIVSQRLEEIAINRHIEYFALDRTQPPGRVCRMTKSVDIYLVAVFLFSAGIASIFAFWSFYSYRNWQITNHRKEK